MRPGQVSELQASIRLDSVKVSPRAQGVKYQESSITRYLAPTPRYLIMNMSLGPCLLSVYLPRDKYHAGSRWQGRDSHGEVAVDTLTRTSCPWPRCVLFESARRIALSIEQWVRKLPL